MPDSGMIKAGQKTAYHPSGWGAFRWCCGAPHPLILTFTDLFFLVFANCLAISGWFLYDSHKNNRSYSKPSSQKGKPAMSTVEQLIDFIKNLTPEQAEKIIRQMPRLIASTEEPSQPELHRVS